jgi:hypothetical protein
VIYQHSDFYVPNLATFQNNNAYLGSFHGLRFRLKPGKRETEEGEEQTIEALVWYGLLCLEKSEVVSETVFPMTEEGYAAMLDWLDEQHQIMVEKELHDEKSQ